MSLPATPAPNATPASCPDEDTLVAFARRRLGGSAEASCREHLDGCPGCRHAVGQLAHVLFGSTDEPEPSLSSASVSGPGSAARAAGEAAAGVPRIVAGRYQLGALIGRGGMGAVYEAIQLDLRRPVAVKMLTWEAAASPEMLSRFQREARLAASIGHENIVSVIEVGQTERGEAFLVMERLPGTSLRTLLDGPPLPLRRLVDIVDQVLAALQAVHGRDIIHRDIKPENVFVVPGEDRDRIKVLDFGVSKLRRPDQDTTALTRTGTMIGTPLYMSPEQIVGRADIDPRADLYSVGVILYCALSGRFPFRASSLNLLVAEVLSREPRPLRQVAPWVHDAWEGLLERALGRLPDDRFSDAQSFRQALQALPAAALEGQTRPRAPADDGPGDAGSVGPWPLPALSARRLRSRRRQLAVAAALTASLLGAAAWRATRPDVGPGRVPAQAVTEVVPPAPRAPLASAPLADPATAAVARAAALADASTDPAPPVDDRIGVAIRTVPASARILINGEPWKSPVRTRLARVPGDVVRIEVSAPGFATVTRREPGDADIDLQLQLQRSRPAARQGPLQMKPKLD